MVCLESLYEGAEKGSKESSKEGRTPLKPTVNGSPLVRRRACRERKALPSFRLPLEEQEPRVASCILTGMRGRASNELLPLLRALPTDH
jgi:hypothetical protein